MDEAKQLLKLAKDVLAATPKEPIGLKRDKERAAWQSLWDALDKKHIWNVDYKDWTSWLGKGYWNAVRDYWLGSHPHRDEIYEFMRDTKIEVPNSVTSVPKQLRLIAKHGKKATGPVKEWVDSAEEFLKSWEPYIKIRKDLKQYIVKGRKVDPNAPKKEVFQPSHLDSASRQLIEKTLRKITDTTAPRVAESMAKRYIESAKKFLNDHDGETPIHKFYRSNRDYGSFLMIFVEDVSPNAGRFGGEHYYEMRSDAVQNAKKIAEERTTMMMERFIVKNVAKIGPVMKIKGGLTGIDIINMGVSGPSISANIKVSFNDGTSFEVRNKAVMKWGWTKTFYQFPTTFHNVVFPDGKKKNMVPEKAMNTDWAVAGR